MTEKHQKLLTKLRLALENDPRYCAAVICGSVAKGKARPDSDVDICIVATEEEYNNISQSHRFYFGNTGLFKGEEIEIDGKYISLSFLEKAVRNGNEPVRESFKDALILFDHTGNVENLIKSITKYPEEERELKLKRFYSLFECSHYYATQAIGQGEQYFLQKCITDTVFYAARLVLCYNRLFFPCHKSLFTALEKAEKAPENFISMCRDLTESPDAEKLDSFFDLVYEFFEELNISEEESVSHVLEDEWTWFTEKQPAGQW